MEYAKHPSKENVYFVAGSSGDYECNLMNLTCTCRDFVHRRSKISSENPERICKHLAIVLKNIPQPKATTDINEVVKEFMQQYNIDSLELNQKEFDDLYTDAILNGLEVPYSSLTSMVIKFKSQEIKISINAGN